jgi:hypothetical protein
MRHGWLVMPGLSWPSSSGLVLAYLPPPCRGKATSIPSVVPAFRSAIRVALPSPLRGVLMRRHEGGTGCGARGLMCTQHEHSGGAGVPPGTTKSPCRELSDRPAIAGNGSGPPPEGLHVTRGSRERLWAAGRGPVPTKDAANSMRLMRMWRAGRRPPRSQKDRGHYQSAPFGAPPPQLGGRKA